MKTRIPILILALSICVGFLAYNARHRVCWRAMLNGHAWPPQLDQEYPDLQLVDAEGNAFALSSLRGKVILLEPIGMPCKACQAFCGGHIVGGYAGVHPQMNLLSIEEYFPRFTDGHSYYDPRIAHVQLLLYDMNVGPTDVLDAKRWAAHFGVRGKPNHYVLAGSDGLISPDVYAMIPGFHLIDKNFVLRADSTGRQHSTHDLFTELLPLIPDLVDE